jgi:hypothetical protein
MSEDKFSRKRMSAECSQVEAREKCLKEVARNEKQKVHMKRRKKLERLSIISQFCHLVAFTLERPNTQLECGTLVTSIDIDVGSSRVGERNKGENDPYVHGYLSERHIGEVEENTIPILSQFFDNMTIPVTFAIRGQLIEVENTKLEHMDIPTDLSQVSPGLRLKMSWK